MHGHRPNRRTIFLGISPDAIEHIGWGVSCEYEFGVSVVVPADAHSPARIVIVPIPMEAEVAVSSYHEELVVKHDGKCSGGYSCHLGAANVLHGYQVMDNPTAVSIQKQESQGIVSGSDVLENFRTPVPRIPALRKIIDFLVRCE